MASRFTLGALAALLILGSYKNIGLEEAVQNKDVSCSKPQLASKPLSLEDDLKRIFLTVEDYESNTREAGIYHEGKSYMINYENIGTAIRIGLDPDTCRRYVHAGAISFESMSYFYFLGIKPDTILDYCPGGNLDDSASIIKKEFRKGNISERAMRILKHYNIKNPQRYSTGMMLSLEENMTSNVCIDKPTALFIFNNNDPKGAFDDVGDLIKGDYGPPFNKFLTHYNLLIFEEEKDTDVVGRIREIGKRFGTIDLLVLGAHGNRLSMSFGKGEEDQDELDVFDEDKLHGLGRYFGPESKIILDSCSTGKGGPNRLNIAGIIKKHTGAKVFAPESDTGLSGFEYDADDSVIRPVYNGSKMRIF